MMTVIAFAIRYRRILVYAAGAIAVLLALWWLVSALVDHGRSLERAEWEARQRASEAARIVAERESRRREQTLYDAIATSKQEQANAEANLAAARGRIDDLLRNRPRRPMPGAPKAASNDQTPKGCTGAELYGNDGEVLKRRSERADTIRLALLQCYTQYDAAVNAVNGR